MVTDDELRQIMPNLKADKRALMLPFIQQAMQEFGITTYLLEAAFLAQLAHESAELRYMEEIASGAA
jgi:putative chitinase